MHMEFNTLHHASKRGSTARKIMSLSSNMGAQPEHPSKHRRVNAMFTRLEPPLAHHLRSCSPDLHRRSHPCSRAARECHLIYMRWYPRHICRFSRADGHPPRCCTDCTQDQPVMLTRCTILVSPRYAHYARQLHGSEVPSHTVCILHARD